MALITITGYPSAGKSTRAAQLREYLSLSLPVSVLSDESLNIPRSVYDESHTEKSARAALFTALQRQLSKDAVLIVDAPNYIKGFRYQMYCAAREMKIRVCTLYVVATQDLCREWNASRPPDQRYPDDTLENLFLRYEEPSSMVRWDSPLFTVPWTDTALPTSDILQAITSGIIKPPNSGTLNASKAPTDALLTLESVTLAIISAILSSPCGSVTLPVSDTLSVKITLPPRSLTLSELQRLKRQFVTIHKKAITLGTTERGVVDWSEQKVADKFVIYLEENLKQ